MKFMADQPPASWTVPAPQAIERTVDCPAFPLVEEVVSLFDQLRERLLRYVISFGLPVQDAEDIVQEVFLALFRHLQQGRSRSNLRAWTFRVAHNQALKRRGETHLSEEGEAADSVPDRNPNPEDLAASSQRRRQVLAVLSALREQDRRCLILRAEGLRYREIADVLEISLGAVSLSLSRSLARLARAAQ